MVKKENYHEGWQEKRRKGEGMDGKGTDKNGKESNDKEGKEKVSKEEFERIRRRCRKKD